MSTRWKRNRRLKCECGGYHFPHRRAGGACDHSRTMVFHRSLRQGMDKLDASIEQALRTPGVVGGECPF